MECIPYNLVSARSEFLLCHFVSFSTDYFELFFGDPFHCWYRHFCCNVSDGLRVVSFFCTPEPALSNTLVLIANRQPVLTGDDFLVLQFIVTFIDDLYSDSTIRFPLQIFRVVIVTCHNDFIASAVVVLLLCHL